LDVNGSGLISGNLGLGTASPAAKLDVNGGAMLRGSLTNSSTRPAVSTTRLAGEINGYSSNGGVADDGFLRLSAGGGTSAATKSWIDISGYSTVADMSGTISFGTKGTERVRISGDGRVGIGVTSPRYPLEIRTTPVNLNEMYYGYLNTQGTSASNGTGSSPISISSDGYGQFGGVYVTSDARVKKVLGRSSAVADLATLGRIEITDYTYLDQTTSGNRPHKKVIAQQIEKVYPQAVNKGTGNVPDIFRPAATADGWIELSTDLKVGEQVALVTEQGQSAWEVLEVQPGRFRTAFKSKENKLFVYGRFVNDFLSVDYEAIAMLNVSATQELKREKDAEIAALRLAIVALQAKDQDRDAKLASIEKLLRSSQSVMASPAKSTTASGQE
jgi:hypothetical protein